MGKGHTDRCVLRYMVGTRGKGEVSVSTGINHLGFRTVRSLRMEATEK